MGLTSALLGRSDPLVVTSPLSAKVRRRLPTAKAIAIETSDPPMRDLSEILPARDSLVRLVVTELGLRDLSLIPEFHRLEELILFTGRLVKSGGFSASALPRLRRLDVHWDPRIDLDGAASLKDLMVEKPSAAAVEQGLRLPALDSLDLRVVGVMEPPQGAAGSRVTTLKIAEGRFADGGAWLGSLARLTRLELDGVVGLDQQAALPDSCASVYLEDCGDLGSADGLISARGLRRLHAVGTTRIAPASVAALKSRGVDVVLPPSVKTPG